MSASSVSEHIIRCQIYRALHILRDKDNMIHLPSGETSTFFDAVDKIRKIFGRYTGEEFRLDKIVESLLRTDSDGETRRRIERIVDNVMDGYVLKTDPSVPRYVSIFIEDVYNQMEAEFELVRRKHRIYEKLGLSRTVLGHKYVEIASPSQDGSCIDYLMADIPDKLWELNKIRIRLYKTVAAVDGQLGKLPMTKLKLLAAAIVDKCYNDTKLQNIHFVHPIRKCEGVFFENLKFFVSDAEATSLLSVGSEPEPAKTVPESEPAKTVPESEPAKTVPESEPAKTVPESDPEVTGSRSAWPLSTDPVTLPAPNLETNYPRIFFEQYEHPGIYEVCEQHDGNILLLCRKDESSHWRLGCTKVDKGIIGTRFIHPEPDCHNPWVVMTAEFIQKRDPNKMYIIADELEEPASPGFTLYQYILSQDELSSISDEKKT